ncbi:TSUP family transporter [Saliphagus infecundisoli]|uniref:Probable membrane transporter protein n=1 Tax=Saliphagus infecundisoli TaxID=1849069 RepID=A0ABD5QKY1_9EURY|nr:TSUP family transporter [Saliphagus infecundisoli]
MTDESPDDLKELPGKIVANDPTEIGATARELDLGQTVSERMRLPQATLKRLGLLMVVYLVGLAAMVPFFDNGVGPTALPLLPIVILVALLFEWMDSAAGMGFGTALAPLLFLMGYNPLQVIPVLLISETVTGAVSGGVHHELKNASFSFSPLNEATKTMLFIGAIGSLATGVSITLAYFALTLPESYIKMYVSLLVLAMGVIGVVRARIVTTIAYKPRRLLIFAALAGFNKGIGGGGFGPVVTLGQILSGVYEKSATAIASLAESIVSLVGVVTFFAISARGIELDLTLLPSIYTGGFIAAIGAPYLVRVVPNHVWRYVIPLYAFTIGVLGLFMGLEI